MVEKINVRKDAVIKNAKGAALPLMFVMNEEPDRAAIEEYIGSSRLFMFTLSYCEPPESFGEIMRYQRELDTVTGRRRYFNGTSLIDMSKWIGSEDSPYFDAFLAYLYDNDDGVSYIFAIDNRECEAIYNKLSEYFAVDIIHLDLCKGEPLRGHIKRYFNDRNVCISHVSLEQLCVILEEYAQQNAFNLRRLETVCDRLISAAKNEKISDEQIKKLGESKTLPSAGVQLSGTFGIAAADERG